MSYYELFVHRGSCDLIKAVFFDLDDTLFDHKHSRLCGLKALQEKINELKTVPIRQLECEHETILNSSYQKVLEHKVTVEDSLVDRIGNLCIMHGVRVSPDEVRSYANLYDREYKMNRRSVPGSKELLKLLRDHVKTGVITNGLVREQQEKIRVCQLGDLIDYLIISEEVGHSKPSSVIFEEALKRAGVEPFETLYVGNSWDHDVLPAMRCGIRTVWLNRYGLQCPDSGASMEINSYIGLDIQKIFF